jgi:hypothetical protein
MPLIRELSFLFNIYSVFFYLLHAQHGFTIRAEKEIKLQKKTIKAECLSLPFYTFIKIQTLCCAELLDVLLRVSREWIRSCLIDLIPQRFSLWF